VAAVEIMVLELPSGRPDPGVLAALADAVEQGLVAVLDLVFLVPAPDGSVRVVDGDDELTRLGFGQLVVARTALLSDQDLDRVRGGQTPGTSAAVLVYQVVWSSRVVDAVTAAGGQVALHAHVPVDAVHAAMSMAVS
jgi:hypothetical protein